jgi:hypothetical protein
MKKNSLTPNKGLSLSQAQSISNLCFQRALEIGKKFAAVNNYSKSITLGTAEGGKQTLVKGVKLPEDTLSLLKEKAALHACQAFLMENIKAKDALLSAAKRERPDYSGLNMPEKPKYVEPDLLDEVEEIFGWEQLSAAEIAEYTEAEAFAAHIGQFIHKDGILDHLRNELAHVPAIDWITIKDGEKTPVTIEVHHNAEELLKLHEELAAVHRLHEQRVNYFKQRLKISPHLKTHVLQSIMLMRLLKQLGKITTCVLHGILQAKQYNNDMQNISAEFEKSRQKRIQEIASLRITVDARFQPIIDAFMKTLNPEEIRNKNIG